MIALNARGGGTMLDVFACVCFFTTIIEPNLHVVAIEIAFTQS